MKGKKALGHVEVILSFVIFIGFLTFLFFIFNPLDTRSDSSLVDSVFLKMQEDLQISLSEVSISLSDSLFEEGGKLENKNCFEVDNFVDLNCNPSREVRVRNKDKGDVMASFNSGQDRIRIEIDSVNMKFYTIICSEDNVPLQTSETDCPYLVEGDESNPGDYGIGIFREKMFWSNINLESFENDYNGVNSGVGYETLKERYVGRNSDFGFRFWLLENQNEPLYSGGESTEKRVDAKTFPIEIVFDDSSIKRGTVNILVW